MGCGSNTVARKEPHRSFLEELRTTRAIPDTAVDVGAIHPWAEFSFGTRPGDADGGLGVAKTDLTPPFGPDDNPPMDPWGTIVTIECNGGGLAAIIGRQKCEANARDGTAESQAENQAEMGCEMGGETCVVDCQSCFVVSSVTTLVDPDSCKYTTDCEYSCDCAVSVTSHMGTRVA